MSVRDKKAKKHVITFAASVMLPRFGNRLARYCYRRSQVCSMQSSACAVP